MSETDDTRMPLTSADVLGERMEGLRELIPEAFVEGKVDFERLKAALGEFVDEGRERYGLSWAGKADAIRNIQSPSVGTLVPCPDESVNFDATENLFIEGDNLEVLKLLQKSYYGKVKMIYIDPPYNTGGEFIYPDNYQEGLQEYLRYSGQVGEGGVRLSTNTETSGRYHSKWLDMMYPRLFLARNLLRSDGVIFVSIDDHEVHDLRLLMNEVFGEESFIATICWQKKYSPANDRNDLSDAHDFILAFARQRTFADAGRAAAVLSRLNRTSEQDDAYKNPDNDQRGPWKSGDYTCNKSAEERPNLYYAISHPATREEVWPKKTRVWAYSREEHERHLLEDRLWWGKDGNNSVPAYKRFLSEVPGLLPTTWWPFSDVGHTDEARKETNALLPGIARGFETPKPVRLLKRLIQLGAGGETASQDPAIVMDFFAGSGTFGQAALETNLDDDGKRRFILVQLPEPLVQRQRLDNGAEVRTIADIAKERLKSFIQKTHEEFDGTFDQERIAQFDLGFKVLKLTTSNFKIWDGEEAPADADALAGQLKLFADHVMPDRGEQDILYELMLKAGLPLTAKIEEKDVAGQTAYSIADGLLLICLANPITQESLRAMIDLKPQRVVCLDPAFGGNDQLKTNTVLEMKSHNIEFRTV